MLEHATAMTEKKLAKKLKVFRITDIHVVYTISSFWRFRVSIVPEIYCKLFLYLTR